MLVLPRRRISPPDRRVPWRNRPAARPSPLTVGQKRARWAILAVMLATLVPGDRGLYRLIGLLADRAAIRSEIGALAAKRSRLEAELRRATSDPATIERLAREELDLVRRGETVYKFPPAR